MSEAETLDSYATISEPATVKIQRLLPGPIERAWSYLIDSDKRRQWLAAGDMLQEVGAPFELTWRNDELTNPPGEKPEGFGEEHKMQSRIVAVDAPNSLVFTWGERGEVSFELQSQGNQVLLTLIHRRISDRANMVMIGAGWHMHLDILNAKLSNTTPQPFWDGWRTLRTEYDKRIPQ